MPGSKNSLVLIRKNVKNITRTTTLEKNSKIQTEVIKKTEKKLDTTKTNNQQKNSPKTEDKKITEKKEEKDKK